MRQQAHRQQKTLRASARTICRQRAARGSAAPSNRRHPVRLEGVTHVLGTNCYLCVRAGTPGILNNELYIGHLIWNRLRYLKDPATGRRVSRANPTTAWITTEVPELRIVDDELWAQVKARQGVAALPRGENRGKALSRPIARAICFQGC